MVHRYLFVKARGMHTEFNTVSPPLGPLVLAAIARDELGKEIRYLDTYLHSDYRNKYRELLESFQPEVIGISALTAESECMHWLADAAREICPSSLVIAGGPHPTAYPDDTLKNPHIDIAVINEGEITFREIAACLDNDTSWRDVPGIARRDGGREIVFTPQQVFISDLDKIPFPAFDLVDFDAYAKLTAFTPVRRRRYMNIMTSRGCPYRCTYCHSIQGKKFRAHSPEYVLSMIELLIKDYGIRHFEFIDDIFNWEKDRLEAIMKGIIARNLKIHFSFPNALRGDKLDAGQIELMAAAGLEFSAIAVETASPERQRLLRKFLDIDHVTGTIRELAKRKVFTCGFFMLGFPGETKEEMKNTVKLAIRSKLHMAYFLTVTPFQGTEIHRQALDAQLVPTVSEIYKEQYVDQKINLSNLSDSDFFWLKKWAYLRFYLNPWRVYCIVRDAPSRITLLMQGLGLLRLIFNKRAGNQPLALFRARLRRLWNREKIAEADVNVFYKQARRSRAIAQRST